MKKTLMTQVTNSIFEVMETMFYFTVEEKKTVDSDLLDLLDLFDLASLKACRITFSGTYSGAISLLIPLNVLTTMTENFLGEEEEDLSDEHTDGTLKEALNMIAGNALTKVDKKSYMGLGIPELIAPDTLKPDNNNAVVFNTSDGIMASVVQVDN